MSFEVRFSAEAEANVRGIKDWIAERSPVGVRHWLDALDNAKSRLIESADAFALAPEADAFDDQVRQIHFKTRRGNVYRALFVIRGNVVSIVSVRGAGQDLITPGDPGDPP